MLLFGLPATLDRIDAGDHEELGDLLSAFYAKEGITFDLQSGRLTLGQAAIDAVGFERVEGSGHDDIIRGGDASIAIRGEPRRK